MGTFRRYDCPHIMKDDKTWCKLKANEIFNRTDISAREKYARLRKMTCSGCEIYKRIKEC